VATQTEIMKTIICGWYVDDNMHLIWTIELLYTLLFTLMLKPECFKPLQANLVCV